MKRTRIVLAAMVGAGAMAPQLVFAESFDRDTLEELTGEPITLSATGAPQRVGDAPVDMTIITQDDIRRSGAVDIPGVLERLASADVIRSSRGTTDVSIRGYNTTFSPRLLVLLNGRQVYLDTYGMTNWNSIPVQMAEIRQIEVVNGPNTALFGFNALAGVINIVTYDPLHDDVDAASVTGGHRAYAGASAVMTGQLSDRAGLRLSLGGFQSDSTSEDDEIWGGVLGYDARDPKTRNVAANLGLELTENVRADVEATWSNTARASRFFLSLFDEEAEVTSLKLGVSAETDAGLVNAQAYVNNADIMTNTIAGLTPQDNRTIVASLSLLAKPAAAHTLRPSVEYRHNQLSQGIGDEVSYDVFALSGMWNWQVSDALALTTAARVDALQLDRSGPNITPDFPLSNDEFDQNLTETSFNFGAVYRVTDVDALRFSFARGIGSPSLLEFGVENVFQYAGFPLFFAGNPEIDSTIVHNAELGWERDVAQIRGRFRTALFWQENEDLKLLGAVLSVAPGGELILTPDNFGDSQMFGVEIGANGEVGSLQWRVQYSWRDIEDSFEFMPAAFTLDYARQSPQHVATAGLLWAGDHWEYGADARYTSETVQYGVSPEGLPVPGAVIDSYVQTNMHVAWLPRDDVRLELSGRDIFEARTQTVGISPVERAFYVSLSKTM
jgi:outer membrane receptor for ferrienterochelin and colicins